jgi:serine O-acetyltransferase
MSRDTDQPDGHVGAVGLWGVLREDLSHHWGELTRPGFQALAVQRIGRWARTNQHLPHARALAVACAVLARWTRHRFGIELDPRAVIGRRLSIGHQGGIAIGPDTVIGDDCVVLQGVQISRADGARTGEPGPTIGDGVHLGARAIVQGPVRIGDHARIGPNAVVTTDVPAGATAIARPSRVERAQPATPPHPATQPDRA